MKWWLYWANVVVLVLFGLIAIFSIGAPFLLLGIMLAVLSPWRTRRGVLPTGTAVVLGFVVGFVLVGPGGCTSTAGSVGGAQSLGTTTYSNVLGISYEGAGTYNPSLLPGLLAGIVLAAIAGVTTAWLYRRHQPARPDQILMRERPYDRGGPDRHPEGPHVG
jgi:hypothetical protein